MSEDCKHEKIVIISKKEMAIPSLYVVNINEACADCGATRMRGITSMKFPGVTFFSASADDWAPNIAV